MPKYNNDELIELIKNNIDVKQNYEQLYTQNRGFIYQVVRNRIQGIYEIDDLMQQAFLALVKAVEYYDISRPVEEKNFLQVLKYSIWRELSNSIYTIPVYMQNKIISYKKAYKRLYNELRRDPEEKEIMSELNITLNELDKIRTAMQRTISLDEPIGEEGGTTRLDIYANSRVDEGTCFDELLEQQNLRAALDEALNKLSNKSREIIVKRYYKNWTLERCGQEVNVSRENIRQIENRALRRLAQDPVLKRKTDEYISKNLNEYKTVGAKQFNNTWTSSTEWLVLEREKIRSREEEIDAWLNK